MFHNVKGLLFILTQLNTQCFSRIVFKRKDVSSKTQVAEAYVCTICGSKLGTDQQIYSDLQLAIAEDVKPHEGVKDLLDRYFEDERIEATCCNGVNRWRHIRLINLPSDLSICLVRHTSINNITTKNRKPISIDRILNMGKYMSTQTDLLYRLTGVVIHHGTSPRNGHYTFVKTDGGTQIQINDCSFKVYNGANLLTDSYLLQYEQIPDDEDICNPYLTDLQIHSWKAYKLIQEVTGSVDNATIADIAKAVLTYFSNNCPAALYENFGITSLRNYYCSKCDNTGTYCEQHLVHDYQMLNNPVNTSVTSHQQAICNKCGEQSLTEEDYVINRSSTMIVKDCLDMLKPDQLESLMSSFNPRAIISNSGTVIFKYNLDHVQILLIERYGTICKISVSQVYEAICSTNQCLLFLEENTKQSGNKPETRKYALVKEQEICRNDCNPLSILLSEDEKSIIKKFKAPVCFGSLHLSTEDVNRFLLDDFSDLNIDAFFETLKSKSENHMFLPAVWYDATFSSTFVRKPDTSKSWLNKDLIFVPANVDSNHWVLIVIKPKEKNIY
ncbi:USP44_49 [Mytilus coruscus]|uniref:USP44_49 n=1 Tax=Mytilus coruscus TaxID=42192 RepID=A0A6J8AJG9_MYTCO|nr:USP44_49 [Mytilus coruscus]